MRGRKITAFSNAEEEALGFDQIVPVLAETALKEKGADYRCADPFEPMVQIDGRLITGQNPASAADLAAALLDALA